MPKRRLSAYTMYPLGVLGGVRNPPLYFLSKEKINLDKKPARYNLQEPLTEAAMPHNKGVTMLLKVYTIRDTKAEVYNSPFYKKTHGEAERDFTSLVRDPKSMPHQYPEDFDLYHIGVFDDQTGKMESLATPQHIVKAAHVISREEVK